MVDVTVMRLFCLYDLYDEYEPSPATRTVVTRLKRIHHPGYCHKISHFRTNPTNWISSSETTKYRDISFNILYI